MSERPAKPKPLPRIVAPSACTLIPGDWIGVTINRAPPPGVSPNDRGHPQTMAKAKKLYRSSAHYATISVVNAARLGRDERPFPVGTRLRLRVTIAWPKGHQRLDDVNAIGCVKSAEDGFAEALGMNDRHFTLDTVEQVRDQAGEGWTRIEASVMPEEAPAP